MSETNAERLERLKDINDLRYVVALKHPSDDGCKPNAIDMECDVDWLIEQAERVLVLENSIQKAVEMQEYYLITNGDLQDENGRLKKALYVAFAHAVESGADGTVDVITDTLQGLDFMDTWDADSERGEKLWEEWRK